MSTPFVGEIRLFGFSRIPSGWFACDGSLKSISQYQLLYALIGTTYGGDGVNTFGVPDLRGQIPLHQGTGPGLTPRVLGQGGGTETVTLIPTQIPQHTHSFNVNTTAANVATPGNSVQPGAFNTMYSGNLTGLTSYDLAPAAVSSTGGSQPHNNLMPTLTASFCIAWEGIYPSRN